MARIERQRPSSNIEDRRSWGPAQVGGAGVGGMMLMRLLFSRAGRRLLIPLLIVGGVLYIIPQTRGIVTGLLGGGQTVPVTRLDPAVEQRYEANAAAVLGSTEDVWTKLTAQDGRRYPEPTMVLYVGAVDSACGTAVSAVGPFYCPNDQKLYLDLGFFQEMDQKLGAHGDFAQAYVIAHEVGHHVEKLYGYLDAAQTAQQRAGGQGVAANRIQVRIELMADCLAGVWAGEAGTMSGYQLDPGDVQEAMAAAEAVGDDTLQRKAQGRVVPDSFTHGSAEQRERWFTRGYTTRDPDACAVIMNSSTPYESL